MVFIQYEIWDVFENLKAMITHIYFFKLCLLLLLGSQDTWTFFPNLWLFVFALSLPL